MRLIALALVCTTAASAALSDHRGRSVFDVFEDYPLTPEVWDACAFAPDSIIPRYTGDDPVCAQTFAFCDDIIHAPRITFRPDDDDPYAVTSDTGGALREQLGNCLQADITRYHLLFERSMADIAAQAARDLPADDLTGRAALEQDYDLRVITVATSLGALCADALDKADTLRRALCIHAQWFAEVSEARAYLNDRWPARP